MSNNLSEQVAELEGRLAWREQENRVTQAENARLARKVDELVEKANAAESALAQARVEGAREALGYVLRQCQLRAAVDHVVVRAVIEQKLREYPSTGEEPTRRSRRCPACERHVAVHAEDCPHRPAQPAVPEPPRVVLPKVVAAFISPSSSSWQGGLVNVTEDGAWWHHADATGEWHRIVGPLASRPTASGEG